MRSARAVLPALLVASLSTAVFAPGCTYGFVWDDHQLVEGNDRLASWHSLLSAWTEDFWHAADKGAPGGYYRPLVRCVQVVLFHLGGGDPRPFHAINVALHAVNVLLAWWWATQRLRGPRSVWLSALGLAALSLHPSRAEAVTWVSGLPDVLMTTFALLSLVAWNARRRALCLVCLSLAFLTKETATVLPLVLLLDAALGEPEQRREQVRWALGAGALVGAMAIFRAVVAPMPHLPAPELGAVANALAALGYYVQRTLLPFPPAEPGLVGFDAAGRPLLPAGWLLLGGFTVMLGTLVTLKRRALARECVVWLVPLFPPIAVAALVPDPIACERYLYLSLFGLFPLVNRLCARLATGRSQWVIGGLMAGAVVALGVSASLAVRTFSSDDALVAAALDFAPESFSLKLRAARELARRGEFVEAQKVAAEVATTEGPPIAKCQAAALWAEGEVAVGRGDEQSYREADRLLAALYDNSVQDLSIDLGGRAARISLGPCRPLLGRVDQMGDAAWFYARSTLELRSAPQARAMLDSELRQRPDSRGARLDAARAAGWCGDFKAGLALLATAPATADHALLLATLARGAAARSRGDVVAEADTLVELRAPNEARRMMDAPRARTTMEPRAWLLARVRLELQLGRPDLARQQLEAARGDPDLAVFVDAVQAALQPR